MHKRNMFLLVISRVVTCLIALTMLSGSTVSVFAAGQKERTNETTGYKAVIADEAELLTDSEETRLIEDMMPITRYANIAVYTVDTATRLQDYERARDKRAELFGSDNAAVFMIDMYLRRIVIQRKGNMESYFNNASANNITSNVAHFATGEKYYDVCRTAMLQMFDVIEDRNVPRPMQYICNACLCRCCFSFWQRYLFTDRFQIHTVIRRLIGFRLWFQLRFQLRLQLWFQLRRKQFLTAFLTEFLTAFLTCFLTELLKDFLTDTKGFFRRLCPVEKPGFQDW